MARLSGNGGPGQVRVGVRMRRASFGFGRKKGENVACGRIWFAVSAGHFFQKLVGPGTPQPAQEKPSCREQRQAQPGKDIDGWVGGR
jgi:hypothetical protein